jgi:hypothetical protein
MMPEPEKQNNQPAPIDNAPPPVSQAVALASTTTVAIPPAQPNSVTEVIVTDSRVA